MSKQDDTITRADEGLSIREAAALLGVGYQTIRAWIAADALPTTRFGPSGKIVRIKREDVLNMRRESE